MSYKAAKIARVFSGIQPSGVPHLGNYFGAISQWETLAKDRRLNLYSASVIESRETSQSNLPKALECDTPIFCIVDVHAYTSPTIKLGSQLYQNILDTTASLLAVGLGPQNCILFKQSDLHEHNFLDNVLHNFVTTQRLSRMTQYKDKVQSSSSKGIANGLLTYPVLQAADILLYKTNYVPIGADQSQHLELTRDIARNFNRATSSELLVEPEPLFSDSKHARRIKSLRDPSKKMSKSDVDQKSFIQIVDSPDVLREKVKKAVTDNISEVYFDPERRPGISNLMRIHHLATGENLDAIQEQSANITSAQYKMHLADILINRFASVRLEFERVRNDRAYLERVLQHGRDQAKPIAAETVLQVKLLVGSRSECT